MFDALRDRGVAMLDVFVIHDGGEGRPIPHFGYRSANPLLPAKLKITYTSDSGGPIRREWGDLGACLQPGWVFVLNTHCANYDIDRTFTY
ncbi:MAG: hypothetical protein V3R30_12980, partial [Kiloniellales bacterium]